MNNLEENPWFLIARELACALNDSPCGEWGSKDRSLKIYSEMKEAANEELTFEGYFSDYEKTSFGKSNPYYRCAHCCVSDPVINGDLDGDLDGHLEDCEYRIKKEKELRDKFLLEIINQK